MRSSDSEFALTGGCYSRSPVNIERVKAELVCGNLYINRTITGAIVERQPFGGPLFVRFGEHIHVIGGELARAMRVEVDDA